jgi:Stage II sporulation protein E (SpoIIE)
VRRRVVIALIAIGACERAHEDDPPAPVILHSPFTGKIRYAAKTQPRYSGENNNYFSIVEDARLFLVSDATAPDASKLAAETVSAFPPKACPPRHDPDEALMWCALERANATLRSAHQTSALTAVVVRDREMLVAFAGDVPIVLRHGTTSTVLSSLAPNLGTTTAAQPELRWVPFGAGDTFVIVDRGLLDATGEARVRDAASATANETKQIEDATSALVDQGMPIRDHAELTALFVHVVP